MASNKYKTMVAVLVVVVVAAGGSLYAVMQMGQNAPYEYVRSIGQRGNQEGQFQYVEDFAIDNRGYLYATDALNSNVQVFRSDGTFDSSFAGKGPGDEHMAKPEAIACCGSATAVCAARRR